MPARRLQRGFTRRRFLGAALAGSAAATLLGAPLRGLAKSLLSDSQSTSTLTDAQRRTLDAAVARIVPAEFPGDWSALDAGASEYIVRLLADTDDVYAGGPTRAHFAEFQPLSRVKEMGWAEEKARLRDVYAHGLEMLDDRAGGDFAALPAPAQDAILLEMDFGGTEFFAALFAHTMEGVYAHPVYGGNKDSIAWRTFGYNGDVHGVRFPNNITPSASDGAWNTYGGYAPEEMAAPGPGRDEEDA